MVKTQREKKKEILEKLKEKIEKQKIIILVDFSGIKSKDLMNLREKLKEIKSEMKVTKKTLANLAFKEKKIEVDVKSLQGQLALIFGFEDEILPAKTTFEFSSQNPNLKILGGILENKFFGSEKIIELAKLPPRERLLSMLFGAISAPISNFINVLEGNLRNFIFVLKEIQKVKT